jgi:hypothetical protein
MIADREDSIVCSWNISFRWIMMPFSRILLEYTFNLGYIA